MRHIGLHMIVDLGLIIIHNPLRKTISIDIAIAIAINNNYQYYDDNSVLNVIQHQNI